ncbi:MAG: iron-containing alcohol dehydrogenase [Desulfomonilaceae bacterium]
MADNLWNFHIRTDIHFGRGSVSSLGEFAREAGGTRFLLVADPALEAHGLLEMVINTLNESGLVGEVFQRVDPEPYLDNADEAAILGRGLNADIVIGMGGGSAMDTAKAAAILITNGGIAEQFVGLNRVELPGTPTIMIPTTAGTGSEVTFTAVFTNRETGIKGGINSPFLFPDRAVLDPELTISLPPDITAFTGMDALTHAIESVTGRASTVFTEALALRAVNLIAGNLRRAVFHGYDIEAREKMLLGSVLGGMALADAGVGAAHALAYPLGGNYRIPHGLANAVLLPHVMEFNLPAAQTHFAMIAKSMGETVEGIPVWRAADAAIEAVQTLGWDIGVPSSLSALGIPRADIPMLAESSLKVTRPVENNPRTLGLEDAQKIYERAFG